MGLIPVVDAGKPNLFQREMDTAQAWLVEQLKPFAGNVASAAVFAMRLTAIRFGLLRGPAAPSITQVLDESSWDRVDMTEPDGD